MHKVDSAYVVNSVYHHSITLLSTVEKRYNSRLRNVCDHCLRILLVQKENLEEFFFYFLYVPFIFFKNGICSQKSVCSTKLEPFVEVCSNFPLQLSSRTHFA